MYFKNNNNFFHGVTFHHFHDNHIHKSGQGSINKDQLHKIIKFLGRNNIINADEFFQKLKKNNLSPHNICLTFDDAIKSQIDVALPILEYYKIKSFFFVNTSLFEGTPNWLEIFRYFRLNYFKNVDEFYKTFFQNLNDPKINTFLNKRSKEVEKIKKISPYYSFNDIKFRLVRDYYLPKEKYENVMKTLFDQKNFNPENFYNKLSFDKKDLLLLQSLGHIVGLHSHSHPISFENLSIDNQKNQYKKNISILSKILKIDPRKIKYMSHPCGKYNKDTLKILSELGIELGFRDNMQVEIEKGMKKINNSNLEIARIDHTAILRLL